jgi:4-hydroxy-3-methylbut-2-en-1-yl diphosphate reductase
MELILARHAGFCFGVKRATLLAFEKAAELNGGVTCTLGPIIHSPQVVSRLEEKGVRVIDSLAEIDHGSVILRSHGVPESEVREAHAKGLQVIDATCPFVKKAQHYLKMLSDEGYELVVVGDREHPEVEGIISYAKGSVYVVASAAEAEALPKLKRLGVVAQTTQSYETLSAVVSVCLQKVQEIRVFNTICDATAVRQEEAKTIASMVDCMLVIGGFNSANTRRLAEVCHEIQPHTHHIETVDQLSADWFADVKSVGITAGASTPKWLIDEVIERINAMETDKKD